MDANIFPASGERSLGVSGAVGLENPLNFGMKLPHAVAS